MKVAVLGSGIIGISSAWWLSQAGHDVVVIDRCTGPAQETSLANGAQISVSYAEPWANPQAPFAAEVDVPGRRAAAVPPAARLAPMDVGPGVPARVLARQAGAQHPRHGPHGRIQPRHVARHARRPGHPVRPSGARHPEFLSRSAGIRKFPARRRADARLRRRAPRGVGRRGHRHRARAGAASQYHRRRRLHAGRRKRRRAPVHGRAGRALRAGRRRVSLQHPGHPAAHGRRQRRASS